MGSMDHDVCKTVDYSIIVNNKMVGSIIPDKGLRQGSPLSPHLFILCAEGLSALIQLNGAETFTTFPFVLMLLFLTFCL